MTLYKVLIIGATYPGQTHLHTLSCTLINVSSHVIYLFQGDLELVKKLLTQYKLKVKPQDREKVQASVANTTCLHGL